LSGFTDHWFRWRQQREAVLTHRHGFLAITSINWLSAAPQRFDDAPGTWWTDGDGVHVELSDAEHLELDGRSVTGRHRVGDIPEGDDVMLPWGDAVIEVARRGGDYIVRPRHPDAPVLAGYHGTPAYAPDERWVVRGRFDAFPEPRTIIGASVVDGLMLQHRSPGVVHFQIRAQAQSLVVFSDDGGELWTLFTDGTSGVTTSGSCRMLTVQGSAADVSVVLDFNRARNLPCAYTTLATCPLPPPENRLTIPIEAGEMVPLGPRSTPRSGPRSTPPNTPPDTPRV
jgi:uncharacterized protein (DUF1684 family)